MSPDDDPRIALDQLDALELAELCSFVAHWLTGADPSVGASLERFVGSPGYSIFELRDDLARFAEVLMTTKPLP